MSNESPAKSPKKDASPRKPASPQKGVMPSPGKVQQPSSAKASPRKQPSPQKAADAAASPQKQASPEEKASPQKQASPSKAPADHTASPVKEASPEKGAKRDKASTEEAEEDQARPNKSAKREENTEEGKTEEVKPKQKKGGKKEKAKEDSTLYDANKNPSHSIKGTGFKDAEAAQRTIELVKHRSLTYQFQTINTMLFRAINHPHPTDAMKEGAIPILQAWVDEYKPKKEALREFKLLPKPVVQHYLSVMKDSHQQGAGTAEQWEAAKEFAKTYVSGARLANALVDESNPEGEDWEGKRYSMLCDLVPEAVPISEWQLHDVWQTEAPLDAQKHRQPTPLHLLLILFAWSPVPISTLSKAPAKKK